MAASIPVQIGQVIDNKFRVDRVLAQGGMGVLCAATHLHLDQKIAVKFRLAGSKVDATRFIREAQLAVRLQNRHVCRVMDLGYIGEATPYIVMEYLDGNDLSKEIETRGPMAVEEAAEYMLQACDAMAEAHSLGIVHRDIKPENLFLARQHDGRSIVKVLDFGISKQHGVTLTTESDLMGTPAYMAHEQWASAKHVTASADVYALGATLHFLLAGEPPFHATTIPEMFAKITTQKPPLLRTLRADVPEEIEQLVSRCLARTPAERPADVLEISDALLPFAQGRKRAALSVVGRAFGRSASADASSTHPMSTSEMPGPVVKAVGSPLSTNDLAVSVRSSTDDVPSARRWKPVAIALGAVAVLATIVIAIASSGGRSNTAEPPKTTLPTSASTADAELTPDAAIAQLPDAALEAPDAGIAAAGAGSAAKPSSGTTTTKPAGTKPTTGTRPGTQTPGSGSATKLGTANPGSGSATVSAGSASTKPSGSATPVEPPKTPPDAGVPKNCAPGDYRCTLRK
jgi:serine/threonine protein kinase